MINWNLFCASFNAVAECWAATDAFPLIFPLWPQHRTLFNEILVYKLARSLFLRGWLALYSHWNFRPDRFLGKHILRLTIEDGKESSSETFHQANEKPQKFICAIFPKNCARFFFGSLTSSVLLTWHFSLFVFKFYQREKWQSDRHCVAFLGKSAPVQRVI